MNQHLVSRVLLRRFSNDGHGPITCLDLRTLASRTGRVERFGGTPDVLRQPIEHERRWSRDVERHLPYAFKLLDDGTLLDHPKAIESLKRCMVLHVARSQMVLEVARLTQGLFADQVEQNVLGEFHPVAVGRALTGLTLPKEAAREVVSGRISEMFDQYLREDDFLATLFDELYAKGQERLERFSLEVLEAAEDEFLMSDSPVSFWDRDTDRVGFSQGVSWTTASSVFMPLGPLHVVGLSRIPGWRTISARMVETINAVQIRGSIQEVYLRPGSGLDVTIARHLAA